MKLIAVGLLLCCVCVSTYATTIVAFRTSDLVILATDSKRVYRGKVTGTAQACKIQSDGVVYWAISGMILDQRRGFDFAASVAEAFKARDSAARHISRAEFIALRKIQQEMDRLRIEDPTAYKYGLGEEGGVAAIIFVWYEKGIPHLEAREFVISSKNHRVIVNKKSCPSDCRANGLTAVSAGSNAAITEYRRRHQSDSIVDVVALARHLVELEIADVPEKVGPPITILKLDHDGPHWIQNEMGCPIPLH